MRVQAALAFLEHTARLLEIQAKEASKLGRLVYVEGVHGMSIGAVAGLLVDFMNVDVGICYKVREKGWVNLSIRGRRGLEIHLGEATKRLAKRYGGFGGGHKRAGAASIPRKDCIALIKDLEIELF